MSNRKYMIISFLCLLLISISVNAVSTADSLLVKINSATGEVKEDLYVELSKYYAQNDPDKAIKLTEYLLKEGYDRHKVELLISNADAYYFKNDLANSKSTFYSILKDHENNSDYKQLGYIYYSLGIMFEEEFNNLEAIRNYSKAIEYYRLVEDHQFVANLENSIGIVFERMSIWDKALEHYVQAYVMYERVGDKDGIATVYNNMGNIYQTLMNQEKALEYFEKSKKIYEERNDKKGLAIAYNNIGIIYDELNELAEAEIYYQKSLEIDQELGDIQGVATALNNLGVIYVKKSDYAKAEKNFLLVLAVSDSLKDVWSMANTRINLSEVYTFTNRFDKAEESLQEALLIADHYEFVDLIIDAFLKYSIYYMALSDFQHAYEYFKTYSSLKDSLYSKFSLKIAEIQTVFEAEEKSRELEMLVMTTKHNNRIKILLQAASLVLLILSALLFYLYLTKNKEVKQRKKIEKEQLQLAEIVNQAQESIVMTDLEANILYVNRYFEELTGYSFEEVKGKNPNILQSGETDIDIYVDLWKTMSEKRVWNGTFINRRKNEENYYEAATIFPIKDQDGNIINFASVKRDITERMKASESLKKSEKRFRSMADNINDGLTIIENKLVVYTNRRLSEITGYSEAELKNITGEELAANFERDRIKSYLEKVNNSDEYPTTIEYWIKTKKGDLRYVRNDYSYGDDVVRSNRYIITTDITDKKISEEKLLTSLHEKEVMLKEIHHRVKNNMQVISSLLKLQSSYIKDDESLQLFKNSQSRVKTMALVHEKLYRSKNLSEIDLRDYIRNLTQHIMATFHSTDQIIKLQYDIGEIFLDINSAVPCGLILNELISNAFKYAFPEGKEGLIYIGFNKIEGNNFLFTVKDNGRGLPDDFDINNSATLGMQLINSLTIQLHGNIEIENKNGASFSIYFAQKEDKKDEVLYPKSLKKIISE